MEKRILVAIQGPTFKRNVALPDNRSLRDLIPGLTEAFGILDDSGRSWELATAQGRRLPRARSLRELGIKRGTVLILRPRTVAARATQAPQGPPAPEPMHQKAVPPASRPSLPRAAPPQASAPPPAGKAEANPETRRTFGASAFIVSAVCAVVLGLAAYGMRYWAGPSQASSPPGNTEVGVAQSPVQITPSLAPTPTPSTSPQLTPSPVRPAPVASAAVAITVVKNGGFETGTLSGWGNTPVARSEGAPLVQSQVVHSGRYAAWIHGSASNPIAILAQAITVPSGHSTLTFWYRPRCSPDSSGQAGLYVAILDPNTGASRASILASCSNTDTWTESTFDTSPFAGQTVDVQFASTGWGNSQSSMYVDDVLVS